MKLIATLGIALVAMGASANAEMCTTQSQMQPLVRDGIANAARSLATKLQSGDADGMKALAIPQIAQDFGGVSNLVNNTSPKLKGASLTVESVWLLDASALKPNADGSNATGQFFCSLNNSSSETDFSIDGLPAGKYAFSVVNATGANPWKISMLLREDAGTWKMAGLYPKAATSAGKDGLYYWTTARTMSKQNQPWNAWFYYQQAATLLQPVGFVSSSHLEKLTTEMASAAPPAVAKGVSMDQPYVLRATDGTEYRFTSFGYDDTASKDKVDLVMHMKVETMGDAAAARKRNSDAARAMVIAHPELRSAFHGIWVSSEASGATNFATLDTMENLH